MVPSFLIRVAKDSEYKVLTNLTYDSKAFWNYPDEWMKIWKDELTITDDFIRNNIVYLAESDGELAGYFSIVKGNKALKTELKDRYLLGHLFIKPQFIRKGIGTKLVRHALKICGKIETDSLYVLADPNSRGFYEFVNGEFVEEIPSKIENRNLTVFKFDISDRF